MATITDYFVQAQLSMAAYAPGLQRGAFGSQNTDYVAALKFAGMSQKQAEEFANKYTVVHQSPENDPSGFSATIFTDPSGRYYFAIRGSNGDPLNPDFWKDWFSTNIGDVGLDGIAVKQGLALFNYLQRLLTPAGQLAPQFEILPPDNNPNTGYFGQSTASGTGLGYLVNVSGLTVAGHSLGGHLAMIMSRLVPGMALSVYTYNAPGFDHFNTGLSSRGFFDSLRAAGTDPVTGAIGTNWSPGIMSHLDVAGDFVHTVGDTPGVQQIIFSERTNEGFYDAHLKEPITDSLAIYNLFAMLDPVLNANPNIGMSKITDILTASSSTVYGRDGYDISLENALDALRTLFQENYQFSTSQYNATATQRDGRDDFYTKLYGLTEFLKTSPPNLNVGASTPPLYNLTVDLLTNKSTADYISAAKTDPATRYALYKLNPFTVSGTVLYETINTDRSLDLYDSSTRTGSLSDEYLKDRANFLYNKIQANTLNQTRLGVAYVDSAGSPQHFRDLASGDRLFLTNDPSVVDRAINNGATPDINNILFGGEGTDTITGGTKWDKLYGGAGNDTLTGGQGNDYLEGGQGTDRYNFSAGHGLDQLLDTDAAGTLYYDGIALNGGTAITPGSNTYRSNDNNFTYTILRTAGQPDTLLIQTPGGQINVKNYQAGSLSLGLQDATPPTTQTTFTGTPFNDADLTDTGTPIGLAGGGVLDKNRTGYAPLGTLSYHDSTQDVGGMYFISRAGQGFPDGTRFDALIGNDGDDFLLGNPGGTDNFYIDAGSGNDWVISDYNDQYSTFQSSTTYTPGDGVIIDAGLGHDAIQGGFRDDYMETGAGHDQAMGLEGSDYIDGDTGNDWLTGNQDDDILIGGPDSTTETDNDVLLGGGGSDYIEGGAGNDRLYGDVSGGFIRRVVDTGNGTLALIGWNGQTQTHLIPTFNEATPNTLALISDSPLYDTPNYNAPGYTPSQTNNDYLDGGSGQDQLFGGIGDDILDGGTDNDRLYGEAGDDELIGGLGDDELWGDVDGNVVNQDQQISGTYGTLSLYWRQYTADTLAEGDDNLDGGDGNDRLYGNGGQDTLDGGSGNDQLYGGRGSDILFGGEGDDTLQGGFGTGDDQADWLFGDVGNDTLLGEEGDDYVYGGDGDDTLSGGAGADTLDGGAGNDTIYRDQNDTIIFRVGDGQDQVTYGGGVFQLDSFSIDQTQFSSITGSDGWQYLILAFGTDRIALQGGFLAADQTFSFGADTLTQQQLMTYAPAVSIVGTDGIDTIYGSHQADILLGEAGNDILEGQKGNDELNGGLGNDTYIFNPGDGQDTITDYDPTVGNTDVLRLGAGIAASDVSLRRRGVDLELSLVNTADRLRITDWFRNENTDNQVETIRFADGSQWDVSAIKNLALQGTPGDDILVGYATADTLNGGAGNDLLQGGAGNDTYLFSRGDGQDIIQDIDTAAGNTDAIILGADVLPADVTLTRNQSDLVLKIVGTTDQLTVSGWFASDANKVERLQFVDGTVWDAATIQALADTGAGTTPGVTLIGTAGDDRNLIGGAGDDTLTGLAGRDNLDGLDGNDTLDGGAGDDELDGGPANDILIAGAGNDDLVGGSGDDTYVFNVGQGSSNVIFDESGIDQIVFGPGVTPDDVRLELQFVCVDCSGQEFVLRVSVNGDAFQIRALEQYNEIFAIERYVFADGTTLSHDDMVARQGGLGFYVPSRNVILNGVGGDETLTGGDGDDTIYSGGGSDSVFAGRGNDYIVLTGGGSSLVAGGYGNDTVVINAPGLPSQLGVAGILIGGPGNDTYQYNQAQGGRVRIVDTADPGGGNVLSFGSGISAGSLRLGLGSLMIRLPGEEGEIHLSDFDPNNVYGPHAIDAFTFVDGTVLSYAELVSRGFDIDGSAGVDTLTGTNSVDRASGFGGDDVIRTGDGNDVLNGGTGNDTLIGEAGDDTYWFMPGDGSDVITDSAGADSVSFGTGILAGGLRAERTGDDLVLSVRTNDQITFRDWFTGRVVEQFLFSDGTTLSNADIQALTIRNLPPQLVAPLADQAVDEDAVFAFQIPAGTFTDTNMNDVLTYTASLVDGNALPGWLAFDATTRTFSGTPGNDDVGAIAVRVTATDSGGLSVADEFTLIVKNVNDAPVLANSVADQAVLEDAAFLFQLPADTFTDVDRGDTLSYVATLADGSVLPAWLTFDRGTRTFAGTPANADVGVLNVTVTATDGGGLTASDGFGLAVINVNDAPIVAKSLADQVVEEYAGFRFQVPTNAFIDPDRGDTLSYGAVLADNRPLPAWLSFDSTTHTFSGTPVHADIGTLNLSVTATDPAGLSVSESFVLSVNPAGRPVIGTDGNDWLVGTVGRDTLVGYSGNDILYGNAERDILDAGAGNDLLLGGAGDDLLLGRSGTDVLYGGGGNDTLDGGSGDDVLSDGAGNDVYVFGRGAGQDALVDYDTTAGNRDTVNAGVNPLDLVFARAGSNLQISIHGGTDQVTVHSWYSAPTYQTEVFEAADGRTLLNTQIDQLIQAMAQFTANNGYSTWDQAIDQNPNGVEGVLAGYWQA